MNTEVILGIVRHILTVGGGALITKGLTDQAGIEAAVGAIITLAGFVWSILHKKQAPAAK